MDKTIWTGTGGFPLRLDDYLWMLGEQKVANKGIYDALHAHLLAYGSNYIVHGCIYDSVAATLTEGWIMLDGELLAVDAQSSLTQVYFEKVTSTDSDGDKVFKDSSVQSVYQKNRATLTASSGNLNVTTAGRINPPWRQVGTTGNPSYNYDFTALAGSTPLSFRKFHDNTVELYGGCYKPTFLDNSPNPISIFTLPIGYRPINKIPYANNLSSGQVFSVYYIDTTGDVYLVNTIGVGSQFFLKVIFHIDY